MKRFYAFALVAAFVLAWGSQAWAGGACCAVKGGAKGEAEKGEAGAEAPSEEL